MLVLDRMLVRVLHSELDLLPSPFNEDNATEDSDLVEINWAEFLVCWRGSHLELYDERVSPTRVCLNLSHGLPGYLWSKLVIPQNSLGLRDSPQPRNEVISLLEYRFVFLHHISPYIYTRGHQRGCPSRLITSESERAERLHL